ncbi:MAG TPA: sensor histidine kinase, partial [Gemmatimonadaceae bacterium]
MTELNPALLQGIVTLGTAALCWYLYGRYRRDYVLWWSVTWTLYVLRIAAIAAFLESSVQAWLFVHQVLTGLTALVLLWAALVYTRSVQWRPRYAAAVLFPIVWSYVAIYQLESFMAAALPAVLFLSFATLWTARVFLVRWRATGSRGAAVLGGVLFVWGLHHLGYPLLRARGAWNPWGYYLDILFVLATGIGIVILALEELDRRSSELERLSAQMLRQHEDERRRVSLELHDQTAQVWAAVKLQLGLLREDASTHSLARFDRLLTLVDSGIRSIREVTTELRPPLLDDLGLMPALRALVRTFAEQSGVDIVFDAPAHEPALSPDASLALFRALQEALSNVVRHSGATSVRVRVSVQDGALSLVVGDNGRGFDEATLSAGRGVSSLGLAGMRERIAALRGSVTLSSAAGAAI